MRDPRGPAIVKLGGSHAFSPHLRDWIDTLAGCGGRAVVVPGGGPFADTVRDAQAKIGFDDRAAHRMALLAMEQYGCAIASLHPRLVPAASLSEIEGGLENGRVPVWLPTEMALAAEDIPACWEVTSDSLAVWLAGRLGVTRVMLVKQVKLAAERVSAADLVARGAIDPLFPDFLAASGAAAGILGPTDAAAAAAASRTGSMAGTAIDLP